ncbi:hypothetical protein QS306_03825 [Paraburkholderia bonniea]|uniref:hypothetical protein n=1 Tax=Paraburkholderia bonniea TaxID=2152891 RepID=UPI001292B705|nr:hypothetical protein [Paraburkholderia bonniea]WJF90804.1 hypothetical protein QS306_03825 [Paraburkholderia bonniea]WJF94118.1 hypothetical protein QS308_03825 [Paraburkholderia bonniea]
MSRINPPSSPINVQPGPNYSGGENSIFASPPASNNPLATVTETLRFSHDFKNSSPACSPPDSTSFGKVNKLLLSTKPDYEKIKADEYVEKNKSPFSTPFPPGDIAEKNRENFIRYFQKTECPAVFSPSKSGLPFLSLADSSKTSDNTLQILKHYTAGLKELVRSNFHDSNYHFSDKNGILKYFRDEDTPPAYNLIRYTLELYLLALSAEQKLEVDPDKVKIPFLIDRSPSIKNLNEIKFAALALIDKIDPKSDNYLLDSDEPQKKILAIPQSNSTAVTIFYQHLANQYSIGPDSISDKPKLEEKHIQHYIALLDSILLNKDAANQRIHTHWIKEKIRHAQQAITSEGGLAKAVTFNLSNAFLAGFQVIYSEKLHHLIKLKNVNEFIQHFPTHILPKK